MPSWWFAGESVKSQYQQYWFAIGSNYCNSVDATRFEFHDIRLADACLIPSANEILSNKIGQSIDFTMILQLINVDNKAVVLYTLS